MYAYHTHFKSYTESKPRTDEFSHSSTTEWTPVGKLTPANWEHYPELVSHFELERGKDYYLVYVIYSTGDSFGFDAKSNCEFVMILQTKERAEALRKLILARSIQPTHTRTPRSLTFEDEGGQVMHIPEPWDSYFDKVEEISVLPVQLGDV